MNTIILIILFGAVLLLVYLQFRKAQKQNEALRTNLEAQQARAKSQSLAHEQRLKEKEQAITDLQQTIRNGEDTQQTLQTQLSQAQHDLSNKETELQQVSNTLTTYKQEIEQQQVKATQLEQTIAAQQQRIDHLLKEVDQLKLEKPCPRSIMQIYGNLISTETATPTHAGTTQIGQEIEPIRTEGSNYPYYMIEQNHTPVVAPIAIKQAPMTLGIYLLRERLRESLRPHPEVELLEAVALPVINRPYSFVPGIALYIKPCNLYVNVEIDTPYDLIHRRSTHYVGRTDLLRNLYFVESGWMVCHFAERQVVEQPSEVVAALHRLLAHLSNEESLIQKEEDNLQKLPRWTFKEAELMEQRHERETYLIAANQELFEQNADPYEGDKPGIDILPDRTAQIEKQLAATQGHPYTKVTVRTYSNEYLFETGTQQNESNDFEKGWRIQDLVEKKELFVPFSDIVAVTPLDSLWLYPAYEQTGETGNPQPVSALIREAILTLRPIAITYKNNAGEIHDRDVLYLSYWIFNNKTGQDYTYNETLPLLFHTKFLEYDCSYFTGYCNFRHTSRVFASQNIQHMAVYNCHKSCFPFGPEQLWTCLTADKPEMACLLYSSFNCEKQLIPSCLTAYAYALAMLDQTKEAVHALMSYDKDYRPYPTLDMTWQQAIQTEITELTDQSDRRKKFEPIVFALQEAGWDLELPAE